MTGVEQSKKAPPPRSYVEDAACSMVYYAAERTLMAWVRVALGGSFMAVVEIAAVLATVRY